MKIRSEYPNDFPIIDAVNRLAFADDPRSLRNEHAIVRALRAKGDLAVSLVAELGNQVVGHVAISPVSISDGTPHWYGLGPVAVFPEHQRRGIGQALIREALGHLQRLEGAGCVVLGEPGFYGHFGFRPKSDLVLPGVPPAYFQSLRFFGPNPHGEVTYSGAFNTGL